ncbi:hypothetical protein BRADI_3g57496v3 [Brachypodium distachyon]|uniref:WRC domain-containing protein n=1 Tax=Brachypodium distachyon TaxID=15368 RepID=A0A0Q3FRJ5_BRADI|nr:hypothetical protein BRADI_3g57496v3 [Brachypodium distachyon]
MAWISREEVRRRCLCELCSRRPVVDLELTLALPSPAPAPHQACNVVACDCQLYFFAGAGAGRQGVAAADDGHAIRYVRNDPGGPGDNNPEPWPLMMVNAENRLNEVVPAAMPPAPSEALNNGRVREKRRRTPTPVAGSRCSRSNGKGWRCEKPMQGTSCLCEHHRNKDLDRTARSREV